MITASHRACARSRGQAIALQALIALAILLPVSACSSGGSATTPSSGANAAAQQTCQQVSAALTNGPDPGADPVGYAEAQILPLRQIRTSDATLGKAIGSLADAYSGYSAANGTNKTVTAALNTAINRINSLCPGAGATP